MSQAQPTDIRYCAGSIHGRDRVALWYKETRFGTITPRLDGRFQLETRFPDGGGSVSIRDTARECRAAALTRLNARILEGVSF